MERKEVIEQLKDLKEHCGCFEGEILKDDVQALDYAIKELERTAQEVPVQEQLPEIKIDGKTIASSILKTHDS